MDRKFCLAAIVLGLLAASPAPADENDFLPGDANDDGVASWSDVYSITAWLFCGLSPAPSCMSALDVDANGSPQLTDAYRLATHVVGLSSVPIPDPSRHPVIDCVAHGGGSALEDPDAEIRILDAEAPGGSDRTVSIVVTAASSHPIAGILGKISMGTVIPEDSIIELRDMAGLFVPDPDETDFEVPVNLRLAGVRGEQLAFGILGGFSLSGEPGCPVQIPPGDVPVVRIVACLRPGLPAGDYSLTLVEGELSAGGGPGGEWTEGGRAIHPALVSAKLHVLADVLSDADGCEARRPQQKIYNYSFTLGAAQGKPGEEVEVPLSLQASQPISGFTFSVMYGDTRCDEQGCTLVKTPVDAIGVESLLAHSDGTGWEFEQYEVDAAKGSIAGTAMSHLDRTADMVWSEPTVALLLRFKVRPDAVPGDQTLVAYAWDGRVTDVPNQFLIAREDISILPARYPDFLVVDGRINIIPDAAPFDRGDSNLDGEVNLSDALYTLNFLFIGGPPPACADAADANDDGSVDISDPVATLQFLFLGGSDLPAPSGTHGYDPTPDLLGCSR